MPVPRLFSRRWRAICGALAIWAALVWRRLLVRTTFIAVTGSVGKTTAKECLAAVLARIGPTVKTDGSLNRLPAVARTILRVRPWHRFAVVEVDVARPGGMAPCARLVRPHVALLLSVARAHMKEFCTLENVAREEAELLKFPRPGGIAVLNGDDPRVAAMATQASAKAIVFGSSPAYNLWAEQIEAAWPERLRFVACSPYERVSVQSQLVGTHWVPSVLGALAVARSLGVSLARAAEAISQVPPVPGRLQPVWLPSGAVILRDDSSGSIDTFERALAVLRQASARRRILVIGDCSDFSERPAKRMRYYAEAAKDCAEFVVFVGQHNERGLQAAVNAGLPAENIRGFFRFQAAADFLRQELGPGDLALVRGIAADHFERLTYAVVGTVACQLSKCPIMEFCDTCPQLGFRPDPASRASDGGVFSPG